ncbi:MAG: VanZ family protein [Clostridia bacterium]|nr:VanZ family protein [Clostridia bacterium]
MKEKKTVLSEKQPAGAPRIMLACVFSVYLITVLWYTVGKREAGYYPGAFEIFWSYRLWFAGKTAYGYAILANIAMFVPFGFLTAAMRNGSGRKTTLLVFLLALGFSALIEALQFILLRGCFEYDDIINNVAGALLGTALFWLLRFILPEKLLRGLLLCAGAGIALFCFCLVRFSGSEANGSMQPLSQGLCFQVEEAAVDDSGLKLTGVCFWYEQGPKDFSIVLQSAQTGQRCSMRSACRLPRPDVSAYFNRDDMQAGFEAICQGINTDEEYEILLSFGFLRCVSTRVYLKIERSGSDPKARRTVVYYVPDAVFRPLAAEGTDLEEIVTNGAIRVYNPTHHVYVYWHENKLYWIAEDVFNFEEDGTTRLELELRTTEKEKVPENIWRAEGQYALIGVYFEKSELEGNFGPYRVCVKELPSDYAITSISTGYYSKGWVWKEAFWPVFDFSR